MGFIHFVQKCLMEVARDCLTTGPMSTYSMRDAATFQLEFVTRNLWCDCELHSNVSLLGIQVTVDGKGNVTFGLLHSALDRFRHFYRGIVV